MLILSDFLMFQALLPFTLMDFYVNGVNQLYDLDIDRVRNLLLEINNLSPE